MNLNQIKTPPGEFVFSGTTKGSAVFHAIRRRILLREINPDTTLVEQQIGGEFNCSQGTVREALLRLQEEGLVDRRGYRGTIVAQTSVAEAIQMAKIRLSLEVESIRHAALTFNEIQLQQIVEMTVDMDKAAEEGDRYTVSEIDRLFHLTIFRASGLTALEPILKRCMLHMHLHTFGGEMSGVYQEPPSESHKDILDALEVRDPERSAVAIKTHIGEVIGFWAPPLKPALY